MNIEKYNKVGLFFMLIATCLFITACPHIAYKAIQEDAERAKELNERKPDYSQNSSDKISLDRLELLVEDDSSEQRNNCKNLDTLNNFGASQEEPNIANIVRNSGKMRGLYDSNLDTNISNERTTDSLRGTAAYLPGNHRMDNDSVQNKTSSQLSIESNSSVNNTINKQSNETVLPWVMKINSIHTDDYPNSIELRLSVKDTAGRSIAGLAPPNFKGKGKWQDYWHLLQDSCGGVHKITDFFVEEISEKSDVQNAIAFVLDHSGSMGEGKIYLLNQALARILTALKRQDYVSVVKFAGKSFVQIPLSNDKKYYVTKFKNELKEKPDVGGGTRIYDALNVGIDELAKAPAGYKRSLILLSDGADNSNKSILDSAIKECKKHKVSIISIDFDYDNQLLRDVSVYTGGTYYKIFSIKEFPFVFRDIYYSLNNYYLVRYEPPKCAGIHRVNLNVQLPNITSINASDTIYYDKSIITQFDAAGTTAMLNIEFETGSAKLSESSREYIIQVYEVMRNNPGIKIAIHGHTDDVGAEEDNLILSKERAKSVRDVLISLGIEQNRLFTKGFGESQPLVPNDSNKNRKLNRRTEFVVLENE